MIIRIRLGKGARLVRSRRKNKRLASVVAALLNPAAVMAAAFALWRITADLQLTRSFVITSGLFAHWQVWVGAAGILHVCSRLLNRYSKAEDSAPS
jgi:hypothetical protein